jgi:hypothetical protein
MNTETNAVPVVAVPVAKATKAPKAKATANAINGLIASAVTRKATKADAKSAMGGITKARARKIETESERQARLESKRVNPCLCGCGAKVAGKFKQGHDQRVRGLMAAHTDEGTKLPAVLVKAIASGLVIKPHALKDANQPVLA